MSTYTVFGLWVGDEPLVAGVVEGEHNAVDTEGESGGFSRWATSVQAEDPDSAEALAVAEMSGGEDESED